MERKKSLLDDNTKKLDVWRKIISQTENRINWWSLFLTNHRWAALVNKVKKNLQSLRICSFFHGTRRKSTWPFIILYFTTPVSQEAPQTFVFLCQLSPTKAWWGTAAALAVLDVKLSVDSDVETGQPISLSWLSTRTPSKNPGSPVTKKSKTRMFLGKAFMLICSSFTMVLRNEVYNNLDQE